MLRLDPGEGRIRAARSFIAWEGGGEYNVARGLRRAFGQRCAIVTEPADNEVGRLVEDLIMTGGLDTRFISWMPYDGVGRRVRNGLNFTERGFGVRGAVSVSDRGNTAAGQMRPGEVDWDYLFGQLGVRWLHTDGIYAALRCCPSTSPTDACRREVIAGPVEATALGNLLIQARTHGAVHGDLTALRARSAPPPGCTATRLARNHEDEHVPEHRHHDQSR